jgi:hypothetical protein
MTKFTDLERALDDMPSNNFWATCALFAEMHEEGPEGTKAFTKALGVLAGESMQRRQETRGPIDPTTEAFADVVTGYFDDDGGPQ